MNLRTAIIVVFLTQIFFATAQSTDSLPKKISLFNSALTLQKKRLAFIVGSELLATTSTLILLDRLWYSEFPRSSFHFFNDNNEWKAMDKLGHAMTAYSLGSSGYQALRWTGLKNSKSLLYGGSLGFVFLAFVESFDGFSAGWGASAGDLLANTCGSAFFIAQQAFWKEQKITYKWSFTPSIYAQYRPNVLGKNMAQQWLKDYNAQTYWLSFNITAFLSKQSKFPKWFNLAFGYGADGMTGGDKNPTEVNGKELPSFERARQYYLSIDIDVTRIKTKNKVLKTLFQGIGFIKIPAPAVEFSTSKGWQFHYFVF